MRNLVFLLLTASPLTLAAPVTVYTYDSFTGKDTLGEWMQTQSLKETGCETKYVVFPTAGEALNQVALEGAQTKADIVVGVDQTLLRKAREQSAFEVADASLLKTLEPGLLFDSEKRWVPFDYGYLAVCYDNRRKGLPEAGMTFSQFAQKPEYKKRLVIEDPRTSSLGRSLLVWTRALYPDKGFEGFWKNLLQQTLTISPGWSAAYGLFLSGEADFVVSYTTSPAYHIEKENHSHIRAMIFPEGNYRQVEAAAVVSRSSQKACAKKWLGLLLSKEAQHALPTRQWMYPARTGTGLPNSFRSLPRVAKTLDPRDVAEKLDRRDLKAWTQLAAGIP